MTTAPGERAFSRRDDLYSDDGADAGSFAAFKLTEAPTDTVTATRITWVYAFGASVMAALSVIDAMYGRPCLGSKFTVLFYGVIALCIVTVRAWNIYLQIEVKMTRRLWALPAAALVLAEATFSATFLLPFNLARPGAMSTTALRCIAIQCITLVIMGALLIPDEVLATGRCWSAFSALLVGAGSYVACAVLYFRLAHSPREPAPPLDASVLPM